MEEQEAKDLEIMKAAVTKEKVAFYDYAQSLSVMTELELSHCGYRNGNAEAILKAMAHFQKTIKKLHTDYLKKYPD